MTRRNTGSSRARKIPVCKNSLLKDRLPSIDVGEIRRNLGLTQAQFSARYGFSLASIRNWEAGVSEPYGVAHILLAVIAARPDVVDAVVRPPRPPAGLPDVAWATPSSRPKKLPRA